MNRRLLLAAALLAATAMATPVLAQDMSGSWALTSETPRGAQTMTLVVVQDGSELTGTLTMQRMGGGPRGGGGGGGGGGPMEIEISDGSFSDGKFSFSVMLGRGDRTFSQEFTGRVKGDEMNGTIAGGPRGGDRTFTGARDSQD
jgi:hypothetical protein